MMKRHRDAQDAPYGWRQQAGPIELLLFSLCVYLTTTPFLFVLTRQNPNLPALINVATMQQETQSMLLVYAVRGIVALIGAVYVARRLRQLKANARQLLPLMPFLVWAALSALWSDDFGVTARSVTTLAVLWAGAYFFAVRLEGTSAARAVVGGGALVAVTCLGYVVADPAYAIHQLTDAAQFVHAGAWRGVYQHKNFLGHVAGFFAVAIFWADRTTIPWPPLKWGLIALLLVLVVKSTSASAVPIILITGALVWILVIADPKQRVKALLVLAPAVVALYWGTTAILTALGRDMTFTGRTEIWQIAIDSILTRPLQGYGFVSISYGSFSYSLMHQAGVFDPHSAYLDLALGTGLIGLALFLLILPFAWYAARRLYLMGGGERQAALMLVSITIGWLVSGLTESSSRPLTAMGGLGLFAMAALISLPRHRERAAASGGHNPFAEMRARATQG
jgi:O-antigen ligase